jgi:hypothetical protein
MQKSTDLRLFDVTACHFCLSTDHFVARPLGLLRAGAAKRAKFETRCNFPGAFPQFRAIQKLDAH